MNTLGTRSKNSLLVLTAAGMLSVGLLAGAGLAQTPPACQQTKLVLPDGFESDRFGFALDFNNDFLFVGKSPADPGAVAPGGVYIFEPGLFPNTWVEFQRIVELSPSQLTGFGSGLGVSNNTLIINSPFETGNEGSAYIYRFDVLANTWEYEAKIVSVGSIAISFDAAILGAPIHAPGGINSGSARIVRFNGASWNDEVQLLSSDRASGDFFGGRVALVGHIAIVSAWQDDDLGINSGSVYVFKKIAGTWFQRAKITAPDGAAGDQFGLSVDFDGTTLAIGTEKHDYGESDLGAVYLFKDNFQPGWEFIAKLTPPPNGDGLNNNFGASVDIDGDRLAISATGSIGRGSAHIYRNNGLGWEHALRLVALDGTSGNSFGEVIAIHNLTVAIGAHWNSQHVDGVGAVYTHTNIFIPDCNENCISDTQELADGSAFDCNSNGILDVCDMTDGVTLDCNTNGIPDECEDCDSNGIADECELGGQFILESPQLSPIGLAFPVSHTFISPPEAQGDVTMQFAAIADLAGTVLALDVYLNDVFQGQIFRTTGSRCPAIPDEDQLVISQADFNDSVLNNFGNAEIRIETTDSIEFDFCGGSSWVSVALDYLAPPVVPDENGNGVPDICDYARGDFNLDGIVNITDLLSMLGAWGICPGCPEDTNGDGVVNVIDLLNILANWG